jgi:hypothetical protein
MSRRGIFNKEYTVNVLKRVCGTANRVFLAGLLFLAVQAGAQAQTGLLGSIAILPFSGGTADEGDGIAELFSMASGIMGNFRVMPRTSITRAAASEQEFQANSGMTSADTIVRLGNQFGAEFVMAGSITRVGSQNLLIVSIVKIDVIQQVAGDFLLYGTLDTLVRDRTLIQKMAENLVKMLRGQENGLDRLALLPVDFPAGGNEQEGDALAQLLSIYLLRRNAYAVYPRTKSLEQVQAEYQNQLGGATRDREAVVAGRGENPPFALSVVSRKIDTMNVFNASIMELEGGLQVRGRSEEYATLEDGMVAMEFLARELSGEKVSERERGRRTSSVAGTQAAEEAARKSAESWDKFLKSSGFAIHFFAGLGSSGSGKVEKQSDDLETLDKNEYIEGQTGGFIFPSVELRLWKYFGIQTGIYITSDYFEYMPASAQSPAKYDTLKTVQLPILARVTFKFLEEEAVDSALYATVFGGIALNMEVTSADALSLDPASQSFLIGAGGGWHIAGVEFGVGFLYNGDIGKGTATYKDVADPLSYQRGHAVFFVNIGYEIPFRRRIAKNALRDYYATY